jgi:RNA polymerase sigma-70 factor (ECF subfamily)
MSAPASGAAERDPGEARWMARVGAGDRQALGDLYDRFSGPLYGTALRILREPAEAQDVVHDTFVTVWEKAATYEASRGSPFSWLMTLLRNRAVDRLRMAQRRANLLANAAADADALATGPGASGREAAAAKDDASAVRGAGAALPAEQQRALELAFFGGLTQEEIAERLGEPLGTVKARIRRGLLKLRESLMTQS